MTKILAVFGPLGLIIGIFAAILVAEDTTATLEGTLVCSKCYLTDHSLTNNYHFPMKPCGTLCLENSSPAGLLTEDKVLHAIIAPSKALAEYVGRKIRISGSLHGNLILPTSVELDKSGQWEKIKLGNML